ncbi:uncharacterized protein LOC127264455 [Andrographis paniculata]|uniref:uncharacterized protein LOC127264455 n=1 Tax=Andrographis paniculata TaxID=175694 RepID=UPI0021E95CE2|nr:uncharacterized protein LOC127264455 [Andrographis paniculata]
MSMADQEDGDLKMESRQSMQQHESPEPKRSKPRENSGTVREGESPEARNRRLQRELMAAAAEKRMEAAKVSAAAAVKSVEIGKDVKMAEVETKSEPTVTGKNVESFSEVKIWTSESSHGGKVEDRTDMSETSLSISEGDELFLLIFGNTVSKEVLAQWCNQGIRFSTDPETSMGLVQHEGGPCGVLAAIQAFVLKYLLFFPEESDIAALNMSSSVSVRRVPKSEPVAADIFSSLSEEKRSRALVRSMSEILFTCGHDEKARIVSLNIIDDSLIKSINRSEDEVIASVLGGVSIESGSDLQKFLRVDTYTSWTTAFRKLEAMLPIFRSRLGALIFLISALLSRGVDNVKEDRDDPSQPLVTAPFGHASQEIVNLLLSGSAVANVFDGRMDLGGGMFVKGISTIVEVGFLTLLESLNFCKVGQYLKCPRWPIWVVGSESHYTVLFALDIKVQEENELESRESQIRRAFDAQDQSGGGGFISVEGFHEVIRETDIKIPAEKAEHLCSTGYIVWSEFWQVILDLDKSLGGVKDSSGMMGKKVFDLYHFNGIAKSIANGSYHENPIQRPRLTKLRVSVPPRWTPEEFMMDIPVTSGSGEEGNSNGTSSKTPPATAPAQHAPLVDCIRTRWQRAVCNWDGDAPSIV